VKESCGESKAASTYPASTGHRGAGTTTCRREAALRHRANLGDLERQASTRNSGCTRERCLGATMPFGYDLRPFSGVIRVKVVASQAGASGTHLPVRRRWRAPKSRDGERQTVAFQRCTQRSYHRRLRHPPRRRPALRTHEGRPAPRQRSCSPRAADSALLSSTASWREEDFHAVSRHRLGNPARELVRR
jgi:hypothetical protein